MTMRSGTSRGVGRSIPGKGIVGIVCVSGLLAVVFHVAAPGGLLRSPERTRKLMADHAMLHRAVAEMNAEEAQAWWDGHRAGDGAARGIVVDARARWEYERGHIPGAIHIPAAASDMDRRARLNRAFGRDVVAAHALDRRVPILVYCGPEDCGLDLLLARALMNDGFERVYRLRGGLPAWKGAGGSIETIELLQDVTREATTQNE